MKRPRGDAILPDGDSGVGGPGGGRDRSGIGVAVGAHCEAYNKERCQAQCRRKSPRFFSVDSDLGREVARLEPNVAGFHEFANRFRIRRLSGIQFLSGWFF